MGGKAPRYPSHTPLLPPSHPSRRTASDFRLSPRDKVSRTHETLLSPSPPPQTHLAPFPPQVNFIPSTSIYGHLPGAGHTRLVKSEALPALPEFTAYQTAAPWFLQSAWDAFSSPLCLAYTWSSFRFWLKGHLLQEALPTQTG